MVGGTGGLNVGGVYETALIRRQALIGDSGPAALLKNLHVFGIALFACIGG
jgi:hypothetical protein